MTSYITVAGAGESLRKMLPDENPHIVEIQPGKPMEIPLAAIPDLNDYQVFIPESWDEPSRDSFVTQLTNVLVNLAVTRNTFGAFYHEWEENAFWNYEAAMSSSPVNDLMKYGDYALVVGSGPSCTGYKPETNAQRFVAWSAVDKFRFTPDVIAHCDHRNQDVTYWEPQFGIVFTPSAAREFVEQYTHVPQFVYFDPNNRVNSRFALKRNLPEHTPICGNVVDMLIQCAIYAGHTKIVMVGVDLCYKSKADLQAYRPDTEPIEDVNYLGETVYTDEVFLIFKRGIEGLVRQHPEIDFRVASPEGIYLEGVYRA